MAVSGYTRYPLPATDLTFIDIDDVNGMTPIGLALAKAATQSAGRVALGVTEGGSLLPNIDEVGDMTPLGIALCTADTQEEARTALGVGTGGASDISELTGVTATGLAVATAADAGAARAALGAVAQGNAVPPVNFSAPIAVTGVTGTDRCYAPRSFSNAHMRVSSAPTGSPLTVEVQNWDGFSWNTEATLTIPAGSVVEQSEELDLTQSAGNLLRLSVTSVGSTSAATGVTVDLVIIG